jgi:hypothetical protein
MQLLSYAFTSMVCIEVPARLYTRWINGPVSGPPSDVCYGPAFSSDAECDTADCRLFFWASYLLGFFRCECSVLVLLAEAAWTDRSKEHSECPNPGGSFAPILSL